MEFDNLAKIVTDLPMFGTFCIDISNIDNFKAISNVLFYTKKIELKCVECDSKYPFLVKYSIKKDGASGEFKYGNGWTFSEIDSDLFFKYNVTFPKKDEGIIEFSFFCSMNAVHYQKMYLLYSLEGNTLLFRKIGQKPLNSDLKDKMSNNYKKILQKYNAFDDFRNFEQSESRNLLAGSCTYLRRIFEKMVNQMLESDEISKELKGKAKHFEDKISLVKTLFDIDIQDILNSSYSLLSKGIHELNNEEIEEFYSLMLEVICIQLESEYEKDLKAKQREQLKKNINSAITKFGKKQ